MKAAHLARRSVLLLAAAVALIAGWKVMASRVDAEPTLGFINIEPFPIGIVKVSVDDRVIYEGLPIEHPSEVHPMHFHLFKFRMQKRRAHLNVSWADNKGRLLINEAELAYQAKGCEFYCNLAAREMQCACVGREEYDVGR